MGLSHSSCSHCLSLFMHAAQILYRRSDLGLFLWPMWSVSWNLSALKPFAIGRCPKWQGFLREEALGKISLTDLALCPFPSLPFHPGSVIEFSGTNAFQIFAECSPTPLSWCWGQAGKFCSFRFTHKSFFPFPFNASVVLPAPACGEFWKLAASL